MCLPMLARASSITLSGQLIRVGINLALHVLIARSLSLEDRGVYALAVSVGATLLLVTNWGNEYGVRYLYNTNKISKQDLVLYLLATSAVSFFAACALLHLGMVVLPLETWFTDGLFLPLLAVALAFSQLLCTQVNVFLTLDHKYTTAATIAIIEELLKIGLVACLLLAGITPSAIVWCFITVNLAIFFFVLVRFELLPRRNSKLEISQMAAVYSYGLRSLLLNASGYGYTHIPILMLSTRLSPEQIGLFSVIYNLAGRIQVLPDAINRVMVPLSRDSLNDARLMLVIKVIAIIFLVVAGLLLIFFHFGNSILYILFGEQYAGFGFLLTLCLFGFGFRFMTRPIEVFYIEVVGRPGLVSVFQLMALAFLVTACALSTASDDLESAVQAIAGSMVLSFILIAVRFCVQEEINFVPALSQLRRSLDVKRQGKG